MSNNYFQFKKFVVRQDSCAMKVGTDGTLLGSWARGGRKILDIGTGTGLVALMMAQRFEDAELYAVEIDRDAHLQAMDNVENSPFNGRIKLFNQSIQDFSTEYADEKFDSIVCNPPFYVNSLGCPDDKRHIARHSSSLPFDVLLRSVKNLLSDEGRLSVVIPTDSHPSFDAEARMSGFRCSRLCRIRTVERKPPKRMLLEYVLHGGIEMQYEEHCLQDNDGRRSEWYSDITSEFYVR